MELVADESGKHIDHVEVAGLWTSAFTVRARNFVLATGGIENARLLLVSRRHNHAGLGNQRDLVGRYFMEHPHIRSGVLIPDVDDLVDRIGLYSRHRGNGSQIIGMLTLSPQTLRKEGILNTAVSLSPSDEVRVSDTFRSMAIVVGALKKRRRPSDGLLRAHLSNVVSRPVQSVRTVATQTGRAARNRRVMQLTIHAEQSPNPSSRVSLSAELDPLGFPRARLDWQLNDLDYESVRRTQEIIDEAVQQSGIGRVEKKLGTERPPAAIRGQWHHIGTTRMHADPLQGVVDPDCRVHSLANLYVAGSSVFPTGGYANPTTTIVAMALRLADHLKATMGVP